MNFLFNYWFMFGGLGIPALGISGIALATIFIEFLGVVYLFPKVIRTGLVSKTFIKEIFPDKEVYKDIARQGLPASVSMMSVAIGFFISTYFVGKFGEGAVAAYGVGTRIQQLMLLPLVGVNIAVVTLIGQNNGAKRLDRVMETIKTTFRYIFWIALVGTVLLFFLAKPLMTLFTKDKEVIGVGVTFLRITAFMMWPYALLMTIDSVLRGFKRPMFSLWMGLSRQVIAPVITFSLFVYTLGLNLLGVWWGLFVIVWSASLVAYLYLRRVLNKVLGRLV